MVTLEPLAEDDLDLTDEDLARAGLTAEEIARSPELGAWGTEGGKSGAEYVLPAGLALPALPGSAAPAGTAIDPGHFEAERARIW